MFTRRVVRFSIDKRGIRDLAKARCILCKRRLGVRWFNWTVYTTHEIYCFYVCGSCDAYLLSLDTSGLAQLLKRLYNDPVNASDIIHVEVTVLTVA